MVTTSDGYYSHFENISNIEQTLDWITGLYLKLISRFEKGFRSLDRDLFQAFIGARVGEECGRIASVSKGQGIAPDRLEEAR